MEWRFKTGELVQTRLGKGVVREVRTNARLVVEVNGRAVVVDEGAVAPVDRRPGPARKRKPAPAPAPRAHQPSGRPASSGVPPAEVDLHGLTVGEALARMEQVLNDALLADLPELRLIHGKGGGRIRAALHRRLRGISAVRAFRLDPRNAGVTIVSL
jgi:dsDNA-specific endonuclease/ATPase MutS2